MRIPTAKELADETAALLAREADEYGRKGYRVVDHGVRTEDDGAVVGKITMVVPAELDFIVLNLEVPEDEP